MGQLARESRCDRFISEFNEDYKKKLTPVFNDAFVSSGLGIHHVLQVVMFWVTLKDANGNEHTLTDGSIIYDPEEPHLDVYQRLCDVFYGNSGDAEFTFGIRSILERMKKADLSS